MAFIVLGLTTPQLLARGIESEIIEYKRHEGIVPPESFLIRWMIFMESGGRWLLPLARTVARVVLVLLIAQYGWRSFPKPARKTKEAIQSIREGEKTGVKSQETSKELALQKTGQTS